MTGQASRNQGPVKVFITGGTIDGLDYDAPEKAPLVHRSLIPDLLKQARVTLECDVEVLMAKDSRWVTDEDRELIAVRCRQAEADMIVITHGTRTMPLTAKHLGRQKMNKTIVLLGAAVPANRDNSDALFNLGTALAAVQTLPAGVYVTMNGRIFVWDSVRKDLSTGIFHTEQ